MNRVSTEFNPMDELRVGAALRAVRLRRRLRQIDVASRGGVSRSMVSLIERGHLDRASLRTVRRVAAVLDVRIEVLARWRGGELDRLLNQRHSRLHEAIARWLGSFPSWKSAPEVSFSIYGERGIIDILAWHAPTGALLVIELKTQIVDVQELIGTMDRKLRLAPDVARQRGWAASAASGWVVIEDGPTTRRRASAHRRLLRSAFPADGRSITPWVVNPDGPIRALSFWSHANGGSVRRSRPTIHRVRREHAQPTEHELSALRTFSDDRPPT